MADANAGTLSVAITGDISSLLDALQQAQAAATTAGEAITAALAGGAGSTEDAAFQQMALDLQAVGTAAEDAAGQIATADTDATDLADCLNTAATAATDATTALDDAGTAAESIGAAASSVDEVATSLDDASTSAADAATSMDDVASSADSLAGGAAGAEELATGVTAAGEAASEGAISFEAITEQLLEFGAAAGIALSIGVLAEQMTEAVNTVQQLDQSLTFLTGSSEEAAADIEKIQEAAMASHVSFETLAADMQRFGGALGGVATALPLFQEIADAAHTTGQSFDTMASQIDRMVISGVAMTRSLATLQVSIAQLDQATQTLGFGNTFASMKTDVDGVSERVQVFDLVLQKFAGDSDQYAQTIKGAWTDFSNQMGFDFEAVGLAIAPLLQNFLNLATGILAALHPLLEGLGEIINAGIIPVLNDLGEAITGLAGVVGGANLLAIGVMVQQIYGLSTAAQVAAAAFVGWDLGTWLYNNNVAMKAFGDGLANVILGLQNWMLQSSLVTQVLAAMGNAQAQANLAIEQEAASASALASKLAQQGIVISQGTMSLDQYVQALRAAVVGLNDGTTAAENFGTQSMASGQAVLASYQALTEKLAELKAASDAAAAAGLNPGQQAALAEAISATQKQLDAMTGAVKNQTPAVDENAAVWKKYDGTLQTIESDIPGAISAVQIALAAGFDTSKSIANLDKLATDLDNLVLKMKTSGAAATEAGQIIVTQATSEAYAISQMAANFATAIVPLPGWFKALDDSMDSSAAVAQVVAGPDGLGGMPLTINTMSKTMADALNPVGMLTAAMKALGMEVGDDFNAKLQAMATSFQWAMSQGILGVSQLQDKFTQLLAEVTKFPSAFGNYQQVLQNAINQMTQLGGVTAQTLADQVALDTEAMKAAENHGADAAVVLQLAENLNTAKINQGLFNDATSALATLYTNVNTAFSTAWTTFGTGIGDAMVGTESFSKAFQTALDALEKKLAELVSNYLLGQLKDALLSNTDLVNNFNTLFNGAFGVGGTVSKGIAGTQQVITSALDDEGHAITQLSQTATQSTTQVTSGIQQVSQAAVTATSNLLSMLGAIGSVVAAVAGIVGDLEMAHMQEQLSKIELNTRQTANALENGVVNQLLDADQHLTNIDSNVSGPVFQVLVSISSDLDSIATNIQSLLAAAQSGGGLQAATQALTTATGANTDATGSNTAAVNAGSAAFAVSTTATTAASTATSLATAATTAATAATTANTAATQQYVPGLIAAVSTLTTTIQQMPTYQPGSISGGQDTSVTTSTTATAQAAAVQMSAAFQGAVGSATQAAQSLTAVATAGAALAAGTVTTGADIAAFAASLNQAMSTVAQALNAFDTSVTSTAKDVGSLDTSVKAADTDTQKLDTDFKALDAIAATVVKDLTNFDDLLTKNLITDFTNLDTLIAKTLTTDIQNLDTETQNLDKQFSAIEQDFQNIDALVSKSLKPDLTDFDKCITALDDFITKSLQVDLQAFDALVIKQLVPDFVELDTLIVKDINPHLVDLDKFLNGTLTPDLKDFDSELQKVTQNLSALASLLSHLNMPSAPGVPSNPNSPSGPNWVPSPTTGGNTNQTTTLNIMVNSPNSQTVSASIVAALRNNAGLKI